MTNAAGSHNSARLLVVDDHHDTLSILSRLLTHEGYAVATADSIAAALKLCQHPTPPFDLLIADLSLGDGSGIDLLRAAKTCTPPILLAIALSGRGQPHEQQAALDAGFAE